MSREPGSEGFDMDDFMRKFRDPEEKDQPLEHAEAKAVERLKYKREEEASQGHDTKVLDEALFQLEKNCDPKKAIEIFDEEMEGWANIVNREASHAFDPIEYKKAQEGARLEIRNLQRLIWALKPEKKEPGEEGGV